MTSRLIPAVTEPATTFAYGPSRTKGPLRPIVRLEAVALNSSNVGARLRIGVVHPPRTPRHWLVINRVPKSSAQLGAFVGVLRRVLLIAVWMILVAVIARNIPTFAVVFAFVTLLPGLSLLSLASLATKVWPWLKKHKD